MLAGDAFVVLLAVYIARSLHGPAWLAGALFTLNAVLVVASQPIVSRWAERRHRTKVLGIASLLNAAAFALFAIVLATPAWWILPRLILAVALAKPRKWHSRR